MAFDEANSARASIDPAFIVLARSWIDQPTSQFITLVWSAYDNMRAASPHVDGRDLERSITQLLEPRIRDAMSGDEPFYIQHSPFERETMKAAPAQPPAYDLAFVLRADERIMWPLEAKVLETPKNVSKYIQDVQNEFLTCRYAPFSNSGAMLGYLLTGSTEDAFREISKKLGCVLDALPEHPTKPNRRSHHSRSVPPEKSYPAEFGCYHLILEYPDLRRSTTMDSLSGNC